MKTHCPLDRQTLTDVVVQDITLKQCSACSGLWVSRGALQEFARLHDLRMPSLDPKSSFGKYEFSPRIECPSDKSRTVVYKYRGVELDICVHCGGVWLDGGEFDELLKRSKPGWKEHAANIGTETAVQAPELVYYAGRGVLDAGEMAIEFIIEAFSSL